MSPERCHNLIIVEDDEANLDLMDHYLTKGGHQIKIIAKTIEEARKVITALPPETEALIIDANISPWAKDGSEGIELAKLAQKTHPEVPVVGFSINEFPKEATIYVDASSTGFAGLSHVIDALPNKGTLPLTAAPVK